jgi:hypothetical protein
MRRIGCPLPRQILSLPLSILHRSHGHFLATGFLKSTVPGCGHRRDSPNACIIRWKADRRLREIGASEIGASHGGLSSGRAVRRHRETSKILAYGGHCAGAPITGRIGTGAGAAMHPPPGSYSSDITPNCTAGTYNSPINPPMVPSPTIPATVSAASASTSRFSRTSTSSSLPV